MFAVALKAVANTVATGVLSLPNQESQMIHFFDYSILTVSSCHSRASYVPYCRPYCSYSLGTKLSLMQEE